jgi:hypothetical protein
MSGNICDCHKRRGGDPGIRWGQARDALLNSLQWGMASMAKDDHPKMSRTLRLRSPGLTNADCWEKWMIQRGIREHMPPALKNIPRQMETCIRRTVKGWFVSRSICVYLGRPQNLDIWSNNSRCFCEVFF